MTDDFVQAGLFVAGGLTMAIGGSVRLKRMVGMGAKVEATTALLLLMIVVGALLAIVGLGILSLHGSTDL